MTKEFSPASEFPAATQDQWLKLVDKVLAGGDFEKKLVARTYDGIAIQPLYTRGDWAGDADPSGLPGGAPFTRGGDVLGSARGWDIRQRHGHPDPATANIQILADLERGASSIVLKIDPSGANGIAIQNTADFETALKDVYLDLAPVVLEPVNLPLPLIGLFVNALDKRGLAAEKFIGNFGVDGFAGLAATGRLTTDIRTGLARMGDAASYVARTFPNARAFNVRAIIYHSAGAADAQELGAGLATAVEYLRAAVGAGLNVDAACAQMAFTVAADADFFMTIAKIRALRKLWGRVAEVSGASLGARTTFITACTAPRMMSQRDPWVNILRTTVAGFAAGIAGANAVTVLPFDSALGIASDLARRIARNTQIVLQEEANLARVIDPAGGAWLFERLTDELADKAWAFFQDIERQGGMATALETGFVVEKIAAVQAERAKNIARRKDALTGVSEFPNLHEAAFTPLAGGPPKRAAAKAVKVEKLPPPSNGPLTKALIAAAKAGASMDDMRQALLADKHITIKPLPSLRLAEGFEALRDTADGFKKEYGQWPKIFLANLGTIAEFTARASYAKNFFEAGGIEAIGGAGGKESAALVRDFRALGARFAVVCSTDAIYSECAAAVAKALKDAGAATVYLAGRPGDLEASLRAAGVDEFIFMGCDVRAVLDRAHQRLKAGR